MARTILRRLFSSVAVLIVVSFMTFVVFQIIPGDPAQLILGTDATPEALEQLRAGMGLNLPWYQQYFDWILGILRGDWGNSYLFGENVGTLIFQRLPVTFSLSILSTFTALLLAAVLGTLSALKAGKAIDIFSRTAMQFGAAIPSFWLSLLLMLLFAGQLGWFPVTGYVPPSEGFLPFLRSITLPAMALAAGEMAILIRIIRSSVQSALRQDFMLSTRAKGLPRTLSLTKYALRSAIVAPIAISGMQFAKLLGGTVIVENIFALPGIGRLLLTAVEQRDILLLQGIVLFVTGMVVLISFATDCLLMLANPTIKHEMREAVA